MATIKDVAKRAGVAVGTVSRYLNGVQLKEVNRAKVEEAIRELNFKPNTIARCLKTNRTNTIGVIIPDLSNIYSTTIVRSIEQKLYEYGYNIFACDSWGNIELEKQKASILAQKMADGLIIYPCSEDISYIHTIGDIHGIQGFSIPVVTIDMMVKNFQCDQVLTDNINATYNAVEWLLGKGHRRIGIISGSEHYYNSRERLKGYIRAYEDYGVDIDKDLIKISGHEEESGYRSMIQLMKLSRLPTAVIAWNYYTTIGMVKAIYDMGIKVPEELSVIGFDNLGLSEVVRPRLSIITQPMDEVGKKAAELILRRINGDYEGFPAILKLKTSFIIRESTKGI